MMNMAEFDFRSAANELIFFFTSTCYIGSSLPATLKLCVVGTLQVIVFKCSCTHWQPICRLLYPTIGLLFERVRWSFIWRRVAWSSARGSTVDCTVCWPPCRQSFCWYRRNFGRTLRHGWGFQPPKNTEIDTCCCVRGIRPLITLKQEPRNDHLTIMWI